MINFDCKTRYKKYYFMDIKGKSKIRSLREKDISRDLLDDIGGAEGKASVGCRLAKGFSMTGISFEERSSATDVMR